MGEDTDPVAEYYRKRDQNKRFFRLRSEEKVDLSQFGKTNYMTSPNPMVGVTKQKNYYTDKQVNDLLNEDIGKKKQRYVFDQTLKSTSQKNESDKLKRDLTVEKFKLMRKIISNEKKAQELLKTRVSELETQHTDDRRKLQSMMH